MKTVGGNPFRIARPSRVRHFAPQDWLLRVGAVLGAAIFAMGIPSSAWAKKIAPLAATVWVANGGAFNAGSVETFAAGTAHNTKPLYRNTGRLSLLQWFTPARTPFAATDPTGVALTPDNAHVTVTGEIIGAALTYSPTANGDTAPETLIFGPDTVLGTPSGDAYGPSPADFVPLGNHQALIAPTNELYVANIVSTLPLPSPIPSSLPTPVVGATITEYPEGANGDVVPDEIIGGDPSVTSLYEPAGIYVDSTTIGLCAAETPADTPDDLCAEEGQPLETFSTRRIWVVQPAIGLVTVYIPEAACGISEFFHSVDPTDFPTALWCANASGNPALQPNVLQQPPIGGIFPTTMDGLLPPVDGGTSTDPTTPEFLALTPFSLTPQVYITDIAGGFHHHGRIKIFNAFPINYCLNPFGSTTTCSAAVQGFMYALPQTAISGKKTRLNMPMGITIQPGLLSAPTGQSLSVPLENLIVTNVNGNSIEQFLSTDSGNVKPEGFIRGPRTKLHQPAGIASIYPAD